MIKIEEKIFDMVEVTISGEFNRRDINRLTPMLKKYARDKAGSQLLLIARNFRGWYGAGPWWSDLKLNDECNGRLDFQRIALIGNPNWRVWMTTLVSSLACSSDIKFFNHEKISRAREWLTRRFHQPRRQKIERMQDPGNSGQLVINHDLNKWLIVDR